jgi:hypothetical protein
MTSCAIIVGCRGAADVNLPGAGLDLTADATDTSRPVGVTSSGDAHAGSVCGGNQVPTSNARYSPATGLLICKAESGLSCGDRMSLEEDPTSERRYLLAAWAAIVTAPKAMKRSVRVGVVGAILLTISSAQSASGQDAPRHTKQLATTTHEEDPAPTTPPPLHWLDIDLGGGVIDRKLSYHQDIGSHPLLPYYLPAGPIVMLNVVAYPHGPAERDPTSNLGFEVELQQGIVSSRPQTGANGAQFDNTVHDFAAGVRYRFALPTADEIYVSATYGEDAFIFSGPNRGDLAIPDTIYRYLRPGIGARVGVGGGFSVRAALGYRALNAVSGIKRVTNAGGPEIEALFPRLVVSGADADLVGDYAIDNRFAVRLGVAWRRYWYSMNSRPGDAAIAGGAVDQSFVFTGAIALTIDQVSTARAADGKPNGKADATGDGDASDE